MTDALVWRNVYLMPKRMAVRGHGVVRKGEWTHPATYAEEAHAIQRAPSMLRLFDMIYGFPGITWVRAVGTPA